MMKSWADHCSSDEESFDGVEENSDLGDSPVKPPPEVIESQPPEQQDQQQEQQQQEDQQEQQPQTASIDDEHYDAGDDAPKEKVYNFPDKPPFTAFVGNLAFSIKEGEDLKQALADLAYERLGAQINVIGGRIALDRRDGKPRGFGYVEVETLDELKLLMKLNDGQSMIAGRKIQLDTANQSQNHQNNRRSNHNQNHNNNNRNFSDRGQHSGNHGAPYSVSAEIDGSKFRGGLRNNRRSSAGSSGPGAGAGPGAGGQGADANKPAGERPSLKLAPRTKPREGEEKKGGSADIFGGAKARDEQAWEKRRQSEGQRDGGNDQNKRGGAGRGRGGRGGRASGGGTPGSGRGGRGDNNNHKRDSKTKRNVQKQQSPEEKAAAAAAAAATATATTATTTATPAAPTAPKQTPEPAKAAAPKAATTNKFALLMDSDSE